MTKQNWRYATKKYDSSRKVSDAHISSLKEAIRYSVSSLGLQPYKVLMISDPQLRKRLAQHSMMNGNSIENASHLFVFAAHSDFTAEDVDAFVANTAKERNLSAESILSMTQNIRHYVESMDPEVRKIWFAKQTYIALGNLINAAAELEIDATPMEGFDRKAYDEILGLEKLHLTATVIATVGYRHENDSFQYLKKVRKPENELFINL